MAVAIDISKSTPKAQSSFFPLPPPHVQPDWYRACPKPRSWEKSPKENRESASKALHINWFCEKFRSHRSFGSNEHPHHETSKKQLHPQQQSMTNETPQQAKQKNMFCKNLFHVSMFSQPKPHFLLFLGYPGYPYPDPIPSPIAPHRLDEVPSRSLPTLHGQRLCTAGLGRRLDSSLSQVAGFWNRSKSTRNSFPGGLRWF